MKCLAFLIGTLLSFGASAFEIDGLTTGLSREKAIAQLEIYGLKITSDSDSNLLASAPGRLYSLSFCKGSLVLVQKHLDPSFDAFVNLVSRFKSLYGSPLSIDSRLPNPTSYASAHGLSVSWRVHGELVTAEHESFSSNSQTSVIYDAPNDCFPNPLFRQ